MDTNKMREQFEAWAIEDAASIGRTLKFERGGDWYLGSDHQQMNLGWAAWQASRAAVVVLPKVVGFEGAYDSLRDHELCPRMSDLDDAEEIFSLCRRIEIQEAIEAQGLKVKS